ncbi:GNAT family N-acetyltransferase [Actinomadura sp. LD22]|uniref:GNAT family N-acetyltransferase n=1 Tax=Actinomadura physcomitrii TaxID=2650748 RepID=A0A6I4MEK9_9ACTN|nr:GNAT family N-acetyltransferase [Actinomadura physcomitrii]MWA04162.1 GNAT family N-acetyltransferase [Actinomadura physcomitrii]
MTLRFELDGLTRPEVHRLLEEHLADMHAASPPESIHALDLRELRDAAVEFWSVWEGPELRGCGALKDLGGGDVELKSMRTAQAARGQGVGTVTLRHLLAVAAGRGHRRVLLETGSQDFFAPARRLYARHGFTPCEPFADYVHDPNSVFMELRLDGGAVPLPRSCPR